MKLILLAVAIISSKAVRSKVEGRGGEGGGLAIKPPPWLIDAKDVVKKTLEDDSWKDYPAVDVAQVKASISHMEVLSFDALDYEIVLKDYGKVWIDVKELKMDLRVHFSKLRVLGLPLHLNLGQGSKDTVDKVLSLAPKTGWIANVAKMAGAAAEMATVSESSGEETNDPYIEANVKGGLRTGWELKSGDWKAECMANGVRDANLAALKGKADLHVNPLFNKKLNTLISDKEDLVLVVARYIVCWKVVQKLERIEGYAKNLNALLTMTDRAAALGHLAKRGRVGEGEIDCWKLKCRDGPCADHCPKADYGENGYCCKRGNFAGGCDGISGGVGKHICVAAPPTQKKPKNLGEPCTSRDSTGVAQCVDGPCVYCGSALCCKKGTKKSECDGEIGGEGKHVCVNAQ